MILWIADGGGQEVYRGAGRGPGRAGVLPRVPPGLEIQVSVELTLLVSISSLRSIKFLQFSNLSFQYRPVLITC